MITATKLTDNSFNIIVKANGVGSEDEQTLVDVVNSNDATSEPKVSIADIHYEILGTGKCTIFFKNDIEKKVEITGRGNYGLKPSEDRIKDAISSGLTIFGENRIQEAKKKKKKLNNQLNGILLDTFNQTKLNTFLTCLT